MAHTRRLIEELLNTPEARKSALFRGPDFPPWLEALLLNAALKAVERHLKPHHRDDVRAHLWLWRHCLASGPLTFDEARALLDRLSDDLVLSPKPRSGRCSSNALLRHYLTAVHELERLPDRTKRHEWSMAVRKRLPALVQSLGDLPCRCGLRGRVNVETLIEHAGPPSELAFVVVARLHNRPEGTIRNIINRIRGHALKFLALSARGGVQ